MESKVPYYFSTHMGNIQCSPSGMKMIYEDQRSCLRAIANYANLPMVIYADMTKSKKKNATRWYSNPSSNRVRFISPGTAHILYHSFYEVMGDNPAVKKIITFFYGRYLNVYSLRKILGPIHNNISFILHKSFLTDNQGKELDFTLMDNLISHAWGMERYVSREHAMEHMMDFPKLYHAHWAQ